ncbi:hypothetical protein LCGC14_0696360 [marine sediment metagenome]|uniref:Uncharacterized protein n=1 Tax=marine sediment metagenome TaxID=412755 RepID=A0A0F9QNU5_9ZZZZ
MIDPIAVLTELGVNTNSPIQAIMDITREQKGQLGWTEGEEFRLGITALVGNKINTNNLDDQKAKYTYLYLVQSLVKQFDEGIGEININNAIKDARSGAKKFIHRLHNDLAWMNPANWEGESSLRPAPTKKKSKGRKKNAAADLYRKNKDTKSRKEIIEMFMKKLDMSKAGATTYFHNCKKVS